jgi:hypothetical protein
VAAPEITGWICLSMWNGAPAWGTTVIPEVATLISIWSALHTQVQAINTKWRTKQNEISKTQAFWPSQFNDNCQQNFSRPNFSSR